MTGADMSEHDSRRRIGKRLGRLIDDEGWTMQDAATRAGIGVKTLYNLREGDYKRAHPPSLAKMCEALGVTERDLTRNQSAAESATDPHSDTARLIETLMTYPTPVIVAMVSIGALMRTLPPDEQEALALKLTSIVLSDTT